MRHYRPVEHYDRGFGLAFTVLATTALAYGLYRLMSPASSGGAHAQRGRQTARGSNWRENAVVGRTVTINRPRRELYAYWRDFTNLPAFMENVRAVNVLGDGRSRWTIAAPGRDVEFTTTITEDVPGELISWKSDEDAEVRNSGRIVFRDAPPGRGTEVEATIAYDPPGGTAGRLVAKLVQKEPAIQARRDLKRFKQLMETGEVSVSAIASQIE